MKREHVISPSRHPREPAAADLLMELGQQWLENDNAILAADEAGDTRAAATLSERADQLEDEIARQVPSSLTGINCAAAGAQVSMCLRVPRASRAPGRQHDRRRRGHDRRRQR